MKRDSDRQVYKLKTTILALVSFIAGSGFIALKVYLDSVPTWPWVPFVPFGDLGAVLVGAGIFGLAWDYYDGRDRERRDDARLRRLLKEAAPDFRDAVVEGFAVSPEDLRRVANPELLDHVASNALGLRLGDAEFAREIYGELVDNVVRAAERWRNVDVRIRLSSIDERNTSGVPRFAVTVTWEYSVRPSSPIRKFAVTSNREEFHELVSDIPSTSTWFMTPRHGLDPSARESYELLQFSVDGEEKKVRRSARKTGQTYSVDLGDDVVKNGTYVRVRHVYRTVVAKDLHRIFLAVVQPAYDLSLSIDYTDTDIASLSVTDLVSSAKRPRFARLPDETAAREISFDVPGWVLPQAEVMFVWTLASELSPDVATRPPAAAA